MVLLRVLLPVFLLTVPRYVVAGCPEGTYQQSTSDVVYCVPIAGRGVGQSQGPQWLTQWGAIALGGGGFGAARGESSKRKAERIAMKACKDSGGGKKCHIGLSYFNQCAAYAVADNYYVGMARGPDLGEVRRQAIGYCGQGGENCRVTYSACSYPAQVVR